MRNRWNIRVLHLPNRARVPFSCHICDVFWTVDVSHEHENMLINRVKDRVRCPECGHIEHVDFKVPMTDLLWRDDE